MTPSVIEIRAQVAAVLERDPQARVLAMHAARREDWPESVVVTDRQYRLSWCESPLAVRMALRNANVAPANGLVILTPLAENELGADVLARLSRARIFRIHQWEIVRLAFRAKSIDGRLNTYGWMADALIEKSPAGGYSPAPAGVLDIDTAWRALLQVTIGLDSPRPDVEELLRWASSPDAASAWASLSSELQSGIADWLASAVGTAGIPILGVIGSGRCSDALALGLIAEVLIAEDPPGAELAAASARVERYTANRRLDRQSAFRWAVASKRVLHDLRDSDVERGRTVLARADQLLAELYLTAYAGFSSTLPAGFEARLERFAEGLQACMKSKEARALDALERLAAEVRDHALASVSPARLERVEMATRLVRWWMHPTPATDDMRTAILGYASDGAFVDWARLRLLGGDASASFSSALDALSAEIRRIREQHNEAFARAIKVWNEAPSAMPGVFAVEDVLDRVVAELAESAPVLLLVMDGLSLDVFAELSADLERLSWQTLRPQSGAWAGVAVAALPTVTDVSRASLLCGRLTRGGQHAEKAAFSQHPALARKARPDTPRLFHKGELVEGSALASEVRKALSAGGPKIVGAVYNAIDDQLDGATQIQMRWTLDDLRTMSALLYEARIAGRVIVLTADHGHVIDHDTHHSAAAEGGDRWRTPEGQLRGGEIALQGGRVLTPEGGTAFVALWSETVRYGTRKNGYHGGVSLQETLVPLCVMAPNGMPVHGWTPMVPALPEWWNQGVQVPTAVAKVAQPALPARSKPAPAASAPQTDLFAGAPLPQKVDWITAMVQSPTYRNQKALAARVAPGDELMRRMLELLNERGGKLSRNALSSGLSLPVSRISGFISAAQRVLNVDQVQVLTVEERSGTVELNLQSLATQFDVSIR